MRVRLSYTAALVGALVLTAACTEPPSETAVQSPPPQTSGSNYLDAILERGVLRVGTTGDFYLSFLDPETGARSGYDIELTSRLAEDMGVEVEYVGSDWPALVSGLRSGRYDITTGATYTAARARAASYTLPIARTGTVAVIRRTDSGRFDSWAAIDAPGVTVAVRQGSIYRDQADAIAPNATVETIASLETVHEALFAGRADVAITGLVDAAELVSAQETLRIAPLQPKYAGYTAMLVPHGAHELRAFVDAWIRSQDHSGFLDELAERWNLNL